jgi:hypothetical protein
MPHHVLMLDIIFVDFNILILNAIILCIMLSSAYIQDGMSVKWKVLASISKD